MNTGESIAKLAAVMRAPEVGFWSLLEYIPSVLKASRHAVMANLSTEAMLPAPVRLPMVSSIVDVC